jgi:hypothetical protein
MTGTREIGLIGDANANQKDLFFLKELLEARKVMPVIDSHYTTSAFFINTDKALNPERFLHITAFRNLILSKPCLDLNH